MYGVRGGGSKLSNRQRRECKCGGAGPRKKEGSVGGFRGTQT